MAMYKVPQDIEVADKILGPLSLKQLIFAIFFCISCYINYLFFRTFPLLIIAGLPFTIIFGVLAFYQRSDQPVEVYLASALRFYTKQRTHVWDQAGYEHRVEITAPKVVEVQRVKGLTKSQIHRNLDSLSAMMDTRGWASRDIASLDAMGVTSSDRVMDISNIHNFSDYNTDEFDQVNQQNDILNYDTTPLARKFNILVEQRAIQMREQALSQMQNMINSNTSSNSLQQQPTPIAPSQQPHTGTTQSMTQLANPPVIKQQLTPGLEQLVIDNTTNIAGLTRKANSLVEASEISLH